MRHGESEHDRKKIPRNNEPNALFALADFHGQHVLEIGCGDGRLT
jgi:hypothetical protein